MPREEESMLDRRTISTLFLAALLAGGCSQNPAPPVPVEGADVSSLSGHWVGEYSSAETGRSGSIVFELKSGNKVAHGDVLMKPKEGTVAPADDPMRGAPQILNINFVNATGGTLRGTMDPYRDPACNCEVVTTFTGRRTGDTIEGTYTTSPQGSEGTASTGRWRITKQK
jgi:hypothetical protein